MNDSPTLTIRGLQVDDWAELFTLWNQKAVVRETFELPYPSEEAFRERFNHADAQAHTLIVETGLPSGRKRIVGVAWVNVQARRQRQCGRLMLVVHPEYRGSAASQALLDAALDLADNWLALRRIEVVVYADDKNAIAWYEQFGFEREAVMRRYVFRDGAYCDACLLARLRVA